MAEPQNADSKSKMDSSFSQQSDVTKRCNGIVTDMFRSEPKMQHRRASRSTNDRPQKANKSPFQKTDLALFDLWVRNFVHGLYNSCLQGRKG
eukprot:2073438-Amphidinium_carterae.2